MIAVLGNKGNVKTKYFASLENSWKYPSNAAATPPFSREHFATPNHHVRPCLWHTFFFISPFYFLPTATSMCSPFSRRTQNQILRMYSRMNYYRITQEVSQKEMERVVAAFQIAWLGCYWFVEIDADDVSCRPVECREDGSTKQGVQSTEQGIHT